MKKEEIPYEVGIEAIGAGRWLEGRLRVIAFLRLLHAFYMFLTIFNIILQRVWMLRKGHLLVSCGRGMTCSISQRLGKSGSMGLCIGMHAVARYVLLMPMVMEDFM